MTGKVIEWVVAILVSLLLIIVLKGVGILLLILAILFYKH